MFVSECWGVCGGVLWNWFGVKSPTTPRGTASGLLPACTFCCCLFCACRGDFSVCGADKTVRPGSSDSLLDCLNLQHTHTHTHTFCTIGKAGRKLGKTVSQSIFWQTMLMAPPCRASNGHSNALGLVAMAACGAALEFVHVWKVKRLIGKIWGGLTVNNLLWRVWCR